jgi:hypothetical protein
MAAAPDTIEPFLGWRTWRVVRLAGGLRLASPTYGALWPPRTPAEALCPLDHEPPQEGCHCGLHALKAENRVQLHRYLNPSSLQAVGEVSLWGRVVEGTHGFRAASAYPRRLWLVAPEGDVKEVAAEALRTTYGLDVRAIRAADIEELLGPKPAPPSESLAPLVAGLAGLAGAMGLALAVALRRRESSDPGPRPPVFFVPPIPPP